MSESDLKELVIPKELITLHKDYSFGRGGYGYVCLCILEKEAGQLEKVAAKMMMTVGNVPASVKPSLIKEACKLREVAQHENIVKLLGVLMETDNYGLILELMVFGDCIRFIKDYAVIWPGNKLPIHICHQVCSAMAYLHGLDPPMLHMDLKGDNILINNNFDAKIGDFGIAEWKTRTTRQDRLGTITHVAPEILNDVNIRSTVAQDVYSFGICLWEIFSRQKPYSGKSDHVIRNCVQTGQRPDMIAIAETCPDYVMVIMRNCWHQDAEFRPSFEALVQEVGSKCQSLKREIFEGKKAVRRKICENHSVNDIKRLQTDYWDNIEEPSIDDGISVDVPNSPDTNQPSVIAVDQKSQAIIAKACPGPTGKRYKFRLPKKELTEFDKKVREILHDPLSMEMIISGYADHLCLPAGVRELISDPKLIQKYIEEDTALKMELEHSSHGVLNNVHCVKLKESQQKGVAMQREKKEDDIFRYTKYYPTKSESEKTEREKRQEARLRSMQSCSYMGKLFKNGLGQKAAKVLKEPYKIQEALNDLETGSGEAEKFDIISPDVLQALQDPVLMQILLSQDPEALDTFMRHYPELTMKLLARNKTQYGHKRPSVERKRSREKERPRLERLDRDPFESHPDDEVLRNMLKEAGLGHLAFPPGLVGSGRMDTALQQMLLAEFLRRRREGDASRYQMSRKVNKMEQPVRMLSKQMGQKSSGGYSGSSQDTGSNTKFSTDAARKIQGYSDGGRNTAESLNDGRNKESSPDIGLNTNKSPLSLEASMDELSLEDTNDGIILYSEMDRDTSGHKLGVTDTITLLKRISKVPDLKLKLVDEIPVAGRTEFDLVNYILSHFNYIFIFVTPNFNEDTLKRFQSQMCLLDTLLTKQWRVVPLMTEKTIPNIPLELQVLRPLAVWQLRSSDDTLKSMFIDSFKNTILAGRKQGFAAKNPSSPENSNKGSILPSEQSRQSESSSSRLSSTGQREGTSEEGKQPFPSGKVTNEADAEPGSAGKPDSKTNSLKSSEQQSTKQSPQSAPSGLQEITHRHAGGGTTHIKFVPGGSTPNLQVGNKNVMIIGASGDERKSKPKVKKSTANVKLTESEDPVGKDDIDMVCDEIGEDWRQLCRKLGFSDGQAEQFSLDYSTSGIYEVMYQAMRRWTQKNPREATKKNLAEILHKMDRDDLAVLII